MNKKKRQNINEQKEKHRTHNMNKAFHQLRSKLPDVPADTKLSKIKTLRLATQYIRTLLNATDPHKLKENDQEYYSNSIHFTENDQSSNNQSMNYYQLNDEDDSFFFFNSQSNLMQSLGRKRKRKSSNVSLEIDQKILKMSPTSDHLHDKKDGKQTNEKIYRVTTKQQGRETNKRNKLDGNIKGNQFVFDYDNQIETMKVLNEHFCQQELSIPNFSDLQSYHFDYSLNSLNPIPPNCLYGSFSHNSNKTNVQLNCLTLLRIVIRSCNGRTVNPLPWTYSLPLLCTLNLREINYFTIQMSLLKPFNRS